MTVIAARAVDGQVFMAADTANTVNSTHIYGTRKIVRARSSGGSELLFGVSGNGALVALIRSLDVADAWHEDPDRWALNLARHLTKAADGATPRLLTRPDDDSAEQFDGTILLGMQGRLWLLLAGMTIAYTDGLAAIGAGQEVALGYMRAARDLSDLPLTRIVVQAVEAACAVIPWCGVDAAGPLLEIA